MSSVAAAWEADTYFAHPYASWEWGINENTNGLLRQYFPKNMTSQRPQSLAWLGCMSGSIPALENVWTLRHLRQSLERQLHLVFDS